MKFSVCIKQVPDVTSPSRIEAGRLVQDSDRLVLNAYDASAVEECLVMRDAVGGEVEVLCVGPAVAKETIRKALAMGADSGVHIVVEEGAGYDSRAYAEMLAAHFATRAYDIIACGKQSQDTDAGLTGSMLAELLGISYASNAVGLVAEGASGPLVVTRQGDSGREVVALDTPCLVTCSNDMNEPRIPTLKGIMASKRKEIVDISLDSLGLASSHGASFAARTRVVGFALPAPRPSARMLAGEPEEAVSALVDQLSRETSAI